MPRTNKLKVSKEEILSLFRRIFITKEEANFLWNLIFERSVYYLMHQNKIVNLFNIVLVELEYKESHIKRNAFGGGDLEIPSRYSVKLRPHPKFLRALNNYD